jgi:hypothetical protein
MSRAAMRAAILLQLHAQQFGPVVVTVPRPVAEAPPLLAPRAWYQRVWRWLCDRYLLTGWTDD